MIKSSVYFVYLLGISTITIVFALTFSKMAAALYLLYVIVGLLIPMCSRSAEKQDWISVEKKMPPNDKMVLIKTINEPIVKYAVASYNKDLDCFVDYQDSELAASHWKYLD